MPPMMPILLAGKLLADADEQARASTHSDIESLDAVVDCATVTSLRFISQNSKHRLEYLLAD